MTSDSEGRDSSGDICLEVMVRDPTRVGESAARGLRGRDYDVEYQEQPGKPLLNFWRITRSDGGSIAPAEIQSIHEAFQQAASRAQPDASPFEQGTSPFRPAPSDVPGLAGPGQPQPGGTGHSPFTQPSESAFRRHGPDFQPDGLGRRGRLALRGGPAWHGLCLFVMFASWGILVAFVALPAYLQLRRAGMDTSPEGRRAVRRVMVWMIVAAIWFGLVILAILNRSS